VTPNWLIIVMLGVLAGAALGLLTGAAIGILFLRRRKRAARGFEVMPPK